MESRVNDCHYVLKLTPSFWNVSLMIVWQCIQVFENDEIIDRIMWKLDTYRPVLFDCFPE